MLRIMRDPKASNTRRDEMARTAAPYLHPKMAVTEPQPQLHGIDQIQVVFVNPDGTVVPFDEPPELVATGPNAPKQLGVDRSPPAGSWRPVETDDRADGTATQNSPSALRLASREQTRGTQEQINGSK
jgi:hypothetical protein